MAVIPSTSTNSGLLLIGGAVTMVFSMVSGLLTLFLPATCTFVGGLQLLILGFLFIIGLFAFLFGLVLARQEKNNLK